MSCYKPTTSAAISISTSLLFHLENPLWGETIKCILHRQRYLVGLLFGFCNFLLLYCYAVIVILLSFFYINKNRKRTLKSQKSFFFFFSGKSDLYPWPISSLSVKPFVVKKNSDPDLDCRIYWLCSHLSHNPRWTLNYQSTYKYIS
jgi:hypothetical protein